MSSAAEIFSRRRISENRTAEERRKRGRKNEDRLVHLPVRELEYPGMGRGSMYERYPKSRQVFDAAGDRIKNLCFEGTAEELKLTENTQPCVYAVTMAAYEAFISRFEAEKPEDAEIAAMAGFSLGRSTLRADSGRRHRRLSPTA